MKRQSFANSVFINCPFDENYAPLMEAAIFCCVYVGLNPLLANTRLEAGENRFDKICTMIKRSKFSIHDLSRSKAGKKGEFLRMNMPFECGIDFGLRQSGFAKFKSKKFLIFERNKYELKQSLSDIAGQDVEHHNDDFQILIEKLRNFLRVEAKLKVVSPTKIISDYSYFQAWLLEKKIQVEGHSEIEALKLPTQEKIDEMRIWMNSGKPLPSSTK